MRTGALDLSDLLNDIPQSVVECPSLAMGDNAHIAGRSVSLDKDIFAVNKRAAWKGVDTDEARCDFAPNKLRISNRNGVYFISLWKKSVYGRTLTDIKADESMVGYFADNIAPLIRSVLGSFLSPDDWAIVTTPKRRHKERNFATEVAKLIASALGLPFFDDCTEARTKQRTNAVFTANNIPPQRNIIVFDDFVTTGQTLVSMQRLLTEHKKNAVYIAGINNKL